jgi:predicted secreted hydrolase
MRTLASILLCCVACVVEALAFDPVVPGKQLEFPRDFGAHPGHRIEWWYATGHLDSKEGPLGFQVTFFRVRNPDAEANASRFAPSQILFAHAALADPAVGKLAHAQRSARALAGLVEASTTDTDVRIDDWSLQRADGAYRTRVASDDFALDLTMAASQAPMLQGERGFSRKGPDPKHASYYYSEPQLRVSGRVTSKGQSREVTGVAWLDHEWSSELLAAEATGWDWLGANLGDGSALMAFRMRGKGGVVWSSATWRDRDGRTTAYAGSAVEFTPRRKWKSPHTGIAYPVAMDVRVGDRTWHLEPLLEDQELDARASTGTVYWEGAVRVSGAGSGRAYLELTGYGDRVPF